MNWCVYGDCNWWGYAKIVRSTNNTVDLLYSEKQHYYKEINNWYNEKYHELDKRCGGLN